MSIELLDEYPEEPDEPYELRTPKHIIDCNDPLAIGESEHLRRNYLRSLLAEFEPGSQSHEHILFLLGLSPDIGHPPRSSLRGTIALDGLPDNPDPDANN